MAAEEFLKLFKFSNNIAQRIARGFFDTTILSCYNNSLSIFLDKNKHTIYHLWSNKVRCCDCVSNPITLPPNQILYKTQFEKMFTITGNYTRGHFIQGKKNCLCAITLNAGCTLDNLDITIISVLTRNCGSLSPNDVSKFVGVADIRNTVTHAPNLEFFKSDELETLWNQLESYVLELTNNCPFKYLYKNVKEEIRALRNTLLTNEEETELVGTIKEENENLANSLLQQIKDTRSRLREKSHEIKQHSKKFDKILEDFSKLLVGINNLNFNVDLQHIASQTDKPTSDTSAKDDRINKSWIGCALLILVCGIAMGLLNQDLSNQIGAFTVGVGACLLILLIIPWKSQNAVRLEDEICEVRWFFTTPSQWDPEDMKKKLEEMASHHNLPFKIRFIYVGSLVIHTTIKKSILNDKGVLNTAIESFLRKMVEICEIDTSIKQTVAVDLLFTESSYSERSTSAIGKVDIGEERVVCPNCSHSIKLQDDRETRQHHYQLTDIKDDDNYVKESSGFEAQAPITKPNLLETLYKGEVLNTLHVYFSLKVIGLHGTWQTFIEERLHELFHCFKPMTPCCKNNSPSPCSSIERHGYLTDHQFFLLYQKDPSVPIIHEKRDRKGHITQHCICNLSPNTNTDVTCLDITLMCILMKTCCSPTPAGNPQWFEDIKRVRNELMHRGDVSPLPDYSEKKNILKNATINIAGTISPSYQKGVIRRISDLENRSDEIKAMIEKLPVLSPDMLKARLSFDAIHIPTAKTESMEEAKSVTDPKKCIVVWTFSQPGDWTVERMQQRLDQIVRLGDFNIEFVYQG